VLINLINYPTLGNNVVFTFNLFPLFGVLFTACNIVYTSIVSLDQTLCVVAYRIICTRQFEKPMNFLFLLAHVTFFTVHWYKFLSRVSTLTRDIDIAILSVCPSVCP